MAVHVANIVDREYVILCDESGTPLRPPLPPGKRKQNLPRQVGRYMVPTPLGSCLLQLFGHNSTVSDVESPALLSHPSIRKQMEEEVKQIANGNIEKEVCVEKNLNWFEQRYMELEESLTRDRVYGFGKDLMQSREYLRYLQRLDAFESAPVTAKGRETSFAKSNRTPAKKHNRRKGARPSAHKRQSQTYKAAAR